jgi:beta-galactosidase
VIDLAGFPKDAYYLYQSLWSDEEVLHLFPHWNWEPGQEVDVWAYYNNADEVELLLNGESMGVRTKNEGEYHVMWRLPFEPGKIRALKKKEGRIIQEKEISTAGTPARIELIPDRREIIADGRDLSFITVKVLDREGNLCPMAANLVRFNIDGPAKIAGVDNGYQASLEPFKADRRKAYNGMCLLIVQATKEKGDIHIEAESDGLASGLVDIFTR